MCLLNDLVTHTHLMKIIIVKPKLTKSLRPQATREQSQERNLRQIRQSVRPSTHHSHHHLHNHLTHSLNTDTIPHG